MGKDSYLPLFETKAAKGRMAYMVYAVSVMIGISLICVYRLIHFPSPSQGRLQRWAWMGSFMAELWFTLYWLITQSVRFKPIYRFTFKHRLSQRYEKVLPKVDIFVCTADHTVEPPLMVINTVFSVMAFDYPPEKLSVYLSDDGGSELMFYALLEASRFAKYWLPFCKKFKIEPRSPAAYFETVCKALDDPTMAEEWSSIKILIDGRRECSRGVDIEEEEEEEAAMPTLVYLAREKRPQYHHNFKQEPSIPLIRVSSRISNGPVILNVDCDMYSNNSESVRDALCFLMDEEQGHRIAFVQFPQTFDNLTKNDVYSSSLRVISAVELAGFDANGGPLYIGTGCFHRREALSGMKYKKDYKTDWMVKNDRKVEESTHVLEETCKVLASCSYEENTRWGKEMGLKYGCPVEDVITGLAIQCRGWRSVYFNPERKGFLGVGPQPCCRH
ncbi:unnamed protein product [Camellia sinensis]